MQELLDFDEFFKDLKLELDDKDDSRISSRIIKYKQYLNGVDSKFDEKKQQIRKLRNTIKDYSHAWSTLIDAEYSIAEALTKFNTTIEDQELVTALNKFPDIFKNMAKQKYDTLLLINDCLYNPLQSYLQKDWKILTEHRKNVDEAYKDHKTKGSKQEKDQKKKYDVVLYRSDNSETETSRRLMEYYICDYVNKYDEMTVKMSFGLLQNLTTFNDSWQNNTKKCLQTVDDLKAKSDNFKKDHITNVKMTIDDKRKNIIQLQTKLKAILPPIEKIEGGKCDYKLHGAETDLDYGLYKTGFIQKRSEGIMKAWQKRYCVVGDGFMRLSHGPNEPCTANLSLLTSQAKLLTNYDKDNKKNTFLLIASNRKFYFASETEAETKAWVSVISNCRDFEIKKSLNDVGKKEGYDNYSNSKNTVDILKDKVLRLVGNNLCADCFNENPEWISTNLGILVCIECSGIHREMGVRVSRIRSITIDNINVSELFLAASIGNYAMNEVMDPLPESHQIISKTSTMDERRMYLTDKYIDRKYMNSTSMAIEDFNFNALLSYDLLTILYLYMNGYDFCDPRDNPEKNTFLHLLVSQTTENYLCVVEFLVQNIPKIINEKNEDGNIPLHLALMNNNISCCKILIRAGSDINLCNNQNISPINIIILSKDPGFIFLRECIALKRTNRLQVDMNVIMSQLGFAEEVEQETILPKMNSPQVLAKQATRLDSQTTVQDKKRPVSDIEKLTEPNNIKGKDKEKNSYSLQQNDSTSSEITIPSNPISLIKISTDSSFQHAASAAKVNDDLFLKTSNLKEQNLLSVSTYKSPNQSPGARASSFTLSTFHQKFNKMGISGKDKKNSPKNPDSKKSVKKKANLFHLSKDLGAENTIIDGTLKPTIMSTQSPIQFDLPRYKVIAVRRYTPTSGSEGMISLDVGEELIATFESEDSTYYSGYKLENDEVSGLFPSSHVHVIKKL